LGGDVGPGGPTLIRRRTVISTPAGVAARSGCRLSHHLDQFGQNLGVTAECDAFKGAELGS